jgi:hypothetical protein
MGIKAIKDIKVVEIANIIALYLYMRPTKAEHFLTNQIHSKRLGTRLHDF